ncbi:MAG: hypothetical protein PVS3B3_03950 [Ktedonobacteraceae bacterium]
MVRETNIANQHLKQQREARAWSRKYVAQQIGSQADTVGRWERGVNTPSPYFRAKLRDLFAQDDDVLGFARTDVSPPGTRPVADQAVHHTLQNPQGVMQHTQPPIFDPAIPPLSTHIHKLVGRDELLRRLKTQLLTQQSHRHYALHGLPGVGKTALAKQLVHDSTIQAHFQHGILWACVGRQPSIINLLSNWGVLLKLPPSEMASLSNTTMWAKKLRDMIGERRMLIVLDDVWKIEDAFALKVGGPHCTYLLTTRFPQLAVQFAAEDTIIVHELSEDASFVLLKGLAPSVVANDPATARILIRAVDGLPLALTIMGSYLQLHAHSNQPRRIQSALDHVLDIKQRLSLKYTTTPAERPPGLPSDASFSLQAVIALSDQQLAPEARQALRALAVFAPKPSTFSEKVALVVAHTSTDVLDALENAGLLEANNEGRYYLHQTISDYARLDGPDVLAEQRLVLYNVNFMQMHHNEYSRLEQRATNILTAMELAVKHNMYEAFTQSVLDLIPFWESRGLYDLAETYLKRALSFPIPHENESQQARLHLALGHITELRGTLDTAEQYPQERE